MEDFLDQVFLSTPWPDVNRPSWVGNTASQTDGFLVDALGAVYEGNEKNLQSSTASSTQTIRSNVNGLENDIYDPENGLHVVKGDIELLSENRHQDGKMQLQRLVETGLKGESLNASSSATFAQLSTKLSGPFEANGNGSSAVEQFLRDSPVLSTWIPQYRTVPVPSPITGQERLQAFGLQNEVAENEGGILEAKHGQFGSLSTTFEQDDMQRAHIPNFSGGQLMMPGAARGVQIQIEVGQVPPSEETNSMPHYANQYAISQFQSPTAAGVGGQGTSKPRARARRGQATDPHSIAERLRREKIAERLKNLQELVPNSNKTDKASSLDEIIEYVKFLQHQVKILSMSRLGAAGAVLPLIADAQSDVGSRSLLVPETVDQKTDLTDSPDDIAFEQEIVKLMESNITSAMQFLQTKGLCLMPIALAAAISNGKLSSDTQSSGWIKPVAPITVAPNGTATSVSSIESGVQNEIRDELLISGSYGAVKPEVHK